MLVATEWSDTETRVRVQVQVSWGCIHEWQKARRRTEYPNWLGNYHNENFALFSCCEMRIVEKKQSSQFLKQSLSFLTCCISVCSWKFGNDWKDANASASVQNEVSPKNQKSYIIDKVCGSWDSKISKAATSPNWKGKKTVGRPKTTADESILLFRILDEIAWDLIHTKWWGWWKTVKCGSLILSCCPRNPHRKEGNKEKREFSLKFLIILFAFLLFVLLNLHLYKFFISSTSFFTSSIIFN